MTLIQPRNQRVDFTFSQMKGSMTAVKLVLNDSKDEAKKLSSVEGKKNIVIMKKWWHIYQVGMLQIDSDIKRCHTSC